MDPQTLALLMQGGALPGNNLTGQQPQQSNPDQADFGTRLRRAMLMMRLKQQMAGGQGLPTASPLMSQSPQLAMPGGQQMPGMGGGPQGLPAQPQPGAPAVNPLINMLLAQRLGLGGQQPNGLGQPNALLGR